MKNRRPGLVVAFICALTLVACRQEAQVAAPVVSVSPSASVSPSPSPTPSPTARAAWPFDGRLLIADR
ncbi:MAG: hypothetical protein ACXVEX_13385, partial [Actinomycetota bacterium]